MKIFRMINENIKYKKPSFLSLYIPKTKAFYSSFIIIFFLFYNIIILYPYIFYIFLYP